MLPRHPKSPEEKAQIVAKVERATSNGTPLNEAIAQAKTSRSAYFRYCKDLKTNARPAIAKDWQKLARSWQPGGGLEELDQSRLVRLRPDVADALRRSFGQSVSSSTSTADASLGRFVSCFSEAIAAYNALGTKPRDYLETILGPKYLRRNFPSLLEAAMAYH